jgi:hypothetical protein
VRKTVPGRSKPAPPAPIRDRGVRNRLPARIFTVDILRGERRIPPIRFPNSDTSVCPPGIVLGMNETCEEKL